jgi:hypothetical protein
MTFVLQVHQDFAHHIQSEPTESVGMWVIFPWPIVLPDGFDRVSTPVLMPARLAALKAEWSDPAAEVPPINPQPIPEPQPESEDPQPQLEDTGLES